MTTFVKVAVFRRIGSGRVTGTSQIVAKLGHAWYPVDAVPKPTAEHLYTPTVHYHFGAKPPRAVAAMGV